VWESNPPPTCLEPDAGFEVRGVHRRRKRFRGANPAPDQQEECTTAGAQSAKVSPLTPKSVAIRLFSALLTVAAVRHASQRWQITPAEIFALISDGQGGPMAHRREGDRSGPECYSLGGMIKVKSGLFTEAVVDLRELPAYNIAEATRYLRIPEATLRSWVAGRPYPTSAGQRFFRPVIHLPEDRQPALSFTNMIEAHVLEAIRRKENITLRQVRTAVAFLERYYHSRHPLAEHRFETDGLDLFKRSALAVLGRAGLKTDEPTVPIDLRPCQREHFGLGSPAGVIAESREDEAACENGMWKYFSMKSRLLAQEFERPHADTSVEISFAGRHQPLNTMSACHSSNSRFGRSSLGPGSQIRVPDSG
jgi:helix-turn-helix protein